MNKLKRVVWKYPLALIDAVQTVEIPIGCDLLCAEWLNGKPTVWALV